MPYDLNAVRVEDFTPAPWATGWSDPCRNGRNAFGHYLLSLQAFLGYVEDAEGDPEDYLLARCSLCRRTHIMTIRDFNGLRRLVAGVDTQPFESVETYPEFEESFPLPPPYRVASPEAKWSTVTGGYLLPSDDPRERPPKTQLPPPPAPLPWIGADPEVMARARAAREGKTAAAASAAYAHVMAEAEKERHE